MAGCWHQQAPCYIVYKPVNGVMTRNIVAGWTAVPNYWDVYWEMWHSVKQLNGEHNPTTTATATTGGLGE